LALALSTGASFFFAPLAERYWPEIGSNAWLPFILFGSAWLLVMIWGLGCAPYQMFNELESEKERLSRQLFNREERQAAMARLWQLRAEGVPHRNERLEAENFETWKATYEDWRGRVLEEAGTISANLEAWLRTLDTTRIPPAYPQPFVSPEHQLLHRTMSEILARMEEFLKAEMLDKDIVTAPPTAPEA